MRSGGVFGLTFRASGSIWVCLSASAAPKSQKGALRVIFVASIFDHFGDLFDNKSMLESISRSDVQKVDLETEKVDIVSLGDT